MAKLNNYIQELKRRKVFKSAGLYAFSSFIILQVSTLIVPALHLPEWTNTLILVLLVLGFPIAMIFAWIYDRTPKGFVKTDSESSSEMGISDDGFPKDAKGNSAIVFIDIVGFSRLMEKDEKKAIDLIHYNRKVLLPFIEKYGGLIVKHVGDGTLCVFSDPAKAVCCSLEIQQVWKGISPMKLKVGIHHDSVIVEEGDILGKGVNFAIKIKDDAESGGICISNAVYDKIQNRPDLHASSLGMISIEGFEDSQELYSIHIPEQFIPMDADIVQMGGSNQIARQGVNYSSLIGWIGGALMVVFLLFAGVKYFTKPTVTKHGNSIAVFPFDNILKNDNYEWLSDGFASTLTYKLSQNELLQVIDQLQVLKAVEKVEPQEAGIAYEVLARKTAETMDLKLLLLGSYQIYGEEIQITTKLVDVESGIVKPLIMERYSLSDPLTMQSDIASKISELLQENTKQETQ